MSEVLATDSAEPPSGAGRLEKPPGRSGRGWLTFLHRALLTAIIGAGAAGVVRLWWVGRGLWVDEGAIAINLRDNSWFGLTGDLEYLQVAPAGWLWLEKAILLTIGPDERALRAPALLGVLAVLVLGPLVASRAAGRPAALITAALLVLAPMMLEFSNELKPYSVEAAVALGLLLLGDWLYRRLKGNGEGAPKTPIRPSRRAAARGEVARHGRVEVRPGLGLSVVWIVATMTAVLLSFAAALVLLGLVVGLMLILGVGGRWRVAMWLGLVSVPAGGLAGLLVYRRAQYPFMTGQVDYFRNGVPPAGSGPGEILAWLPRTWTSFVEVTLGWEVAPLVLGLAIMGVVSLWLRGRVVWAVLLVGPVLAAVTAAAVRAMPLADRLALYLVAPVVILVAAGIDGLGRAAVGLARAARSNPTGRAVRLAAAALCAAAFAGAVAGQVSQVVSAVRWDYEELLDPAGRDDLRGALDEVASRIQPGDIVLVYWFSDKIYRWYGPGTNLPFGGYVRLYQEGTAECGGGVPLDRALGDARRVFYVEGRGHSSEPRNHFALVEHELSRRGHVVESRVTEWDARHGRYRWALVDLTAAADPTPAPQPQGRPVTCLGVDSTLRYP